MKAPDKSLIFLLKNNLQDSVRIEKEAVVWSVDNTLISLFLFWLNPCQEEMFAFCKWLLDHLVEWTSEDGVYFIELQRF